MIASLAQLAHGLLDYPALRPEQLEPAFETLHAANVAALAQIVDAHRQAPSWDGFVLAIERLDQRLEDPFHALVPLVYESQAWAEAVDACHRLLLDWRQRKADFPGLFEAYQHLDMTGLDDEQKVVLALLRRDLRLGGQSLAGIERRQLRETEAAIAQLEQQFMANLIAARDAWEYLVHDASRLSGLPRAQCERLAAQAEARGQQGWLLDLQQSTIEAVLAWADDRALRETVYRASRSLASDQGSDPTLDNAPVLQALLRLRHERAQWLGMGNAAELGLQLKEARSTAQVEAFIDTLIAHNRSRLQGELQALSALASTLGIDRLEPWDTAYLARRLRMHGNEELEARMQGCFPLEATLQRVWQLQGRLLGIDIAPCEVAGWHPDVQVLEVSEGGVTLGHLYLDVQARPGKLPWPHSYPMRQRHVAADGTVTLPAALLSCGFEQAQALGHEDLCQLCHEFGHALNQVLVDNRHRRLNRVAVTSLGPDNCEFVGKLLEQWCWSAPTLHILAQQGPAGVSLSELRQWLAAKRRLQAVTEAEQLRLSWFDFMAHRDPQARHDLRQLAVNASQRVGLPEAFAEDHFAEAFDYMVTGYEAGYYCYKWAQTHAVDAFTRFEAIDADERALGLALRREILGPGARRGMTASFAAFVGRPMSLQAYANQIGAA